MVLTFASLHTGKRVVVRERSLRFYSGFITRIVGKTFTMTGSPSNPGITPRAISRLFQIIEASADAFETTVQVYMVELYNDNLRDLFLGLDKKKGSAVGKPPKLDIKKDAKGMVFVKGCEIRPGGSAEEVMDLFERGNRSRAVGSTKMNAESSRSHLVFSILINSYNKQTKRVSCTALW